MDWEAAMWLADYISVLMSSWTGVSQKKSVKSLNNLFVFIHAFILAVKMKRVLKLFRTYLKDPTIKLDWKETEKNQLDDHFSHKMNHLVC